MAISEFAQHVGKNLELLELGHSVVDLLRVTIVNLIPIKTVLLVFVIKETIMLVDDLP